MIKSAMRSLVFSSVAIATVACQSKLSVGTYASGSVAVSKDGNTVFIADDDNNQLVMVSPGKRSVTGTMNVGNQPTAVLVAPDGHVYVSNKGSRSVSVVDPANGGSVITNISVGAEPMGMALTGDGKTLIVANSSNATVSLVDVPSFSVRATIQTDPDPSQVSVLPNGQIWVTHIRTGSVSVIDEKSATVQKTFALVVAPSATGGNPLLPGQLLQPVIAGNDRVYVVNSQSLNQPVASGFTSVGRIAPTTSAYYASHPAVSGLPTPIVAGAIASVDLSGQTPIVALGEDGKTSNCSTCGSNGLTPGFVQTDVPGANFPSLSAATPLENQIRGDVPPFLLTVVNQPLSGPSAAVIDPTGKFIFIALKNSNNVAIVTTEPDPTTFANISTAASSLNAGQTLLGYGIQQVVKVGAGPSGMAIPPSGDRIYVYSAFDHTLSVISANADKTADAETDRFQVGSSALTPQQDLGRRLFFAADDPRMSTSVAGGIACASCHVAGRDDGRTWQFFEGPRNTPNLAGRHLATTAPYHWDGALNDMHAFNTIVTTRMGGVGDGTAGNSADATVLEDSDFNALLAFMDSQPAPDNPFIQANDPASVQRGAALFASTGVGCAACHSGADFTDNLFHDVGTVQQYETDKFSQATSTTSTGATSTVGVNTPALHNLFASAPYLHDGSAADLAARVNDDKGGMHGHTSQLSDSQKADLVAFLQTL